jgi:hypothetical protein
VRSIAPAERIVTVAAIVVASSILALAQPVQQSRIRGTVEQLDGETIKIKSREGADIVGHLAKEVPVSGIVKITLNDIKPDDYVGSTTTPGPNDTNVAIEIHTVSTRGSGDGSRPWDLKPNSSMTNGAVGQKIVSSDGNIVVLKYRDGEKKITVTPETAIVTSVPADRAELKPGAKIYATATKNADGTMEIVRISVGRDGIAPPM